MSLFMMKTSVENTWITTILTNYAHTISCIFNFLKSWKKWLTIMN
ncbi:hypothetical protein P245_22195 [Comamonas thiooxydans]|uniref:Uncharacterized protein n=1 Tax=Comamonas thiooxydans TaxID=363952 RepID=A0A0E3BFR1_9BURK|nr:hypothetical protein P245_22195 [Comamonas thiooxydans]